MTDAERERTKRYVDIWKRTAVELDRIKCEELRRMTEDERMRQAGEVMAMGSRWLAARPFARQTSGMIDQQHHFSNWKTIPR